MLSDFDLSKQSGEPGGAPATIKQNGPKGVCGSSKDSV
jgi:protein-serine/threonine kinase